MSRLRLFRFQPLQSQTRSTGPVVGLVQSGGTGYTECFKQYSLKAVSALLNEHIY